MYNKAAPLRHRSTAAVAGMPLYNICGYMCLPAISCEHCLCSLCDQVAEFLFITQAHSALSACLDMCRTKPCYINKADVTESGLLLKIEAPVLTLLDCFFSFSSCGFSLSKASCGLTAAAWLCMQVNCTIAGKIVIRVLQYRANLGGYLQLTFLNINGGVDSVLVSQSQANVSTLPAMCMLNGISDVNTFSCL